MIKDKHIGYNNVSRLEPGDRLHFHADEDFREDWDGPRDFDITVSSTFLNSRHGPRIYSVERIPNGRDPKFFTGKDDVWENDWYLDDDWEITIIEED